MIEQLAKDFAVRDLCQALGVSRSGYYAWQAGQQSARELENGLLLAQIEALYQAKRGNYGSPRITQELRRQGQRCNHKRVERLMRHKGLKGRTGKGRGVCTTNRRHDQPVAPNLLLGRPSPQRPDEVWVADITYIPTAQGWLFLAAVMDLYSRQILGWSVWESLEAGGRLRHWPEHCSSGGPRAGSSITPIGASNTPARLTGSSWPARGWWPA